MPNRRWLEGWIRPDRPLAEDTIEAWVRYHAIRNPTVPEPVIRRRLYAQLDAIACAAEQADTDPDEERHQGDDPTMTNKPLLMFHPWMRTNSSIRHQPARPGGPPLHDKSWTLYLPPEVADRLAGVDDLTPLLAAALAEIGEPDAVDPLPAGGARRTLRCILRSDLADRIDRIAVRTGAGRDAVVAALIGSTAERVDHDR